jgi:hypothetical protein
MKSLISLTISKAIRDLDSLDQWQALKHIELRSDSLQGGLSSLAHLIGSTLVMQCECKLVPVRAHMKLHSSIDREFLDEKMNTTSRR